MVDYCKKDKTTNELKISVNNTVYYSIFEKVKQNNIKLSYVNKECLSDEMKQKAINAFLRSYGGNENYNDANLIASIKKQFRNK